MIKKLWKKWGPNPLDLLLKRAQKKGKTRFLIVWNRGLGDIALGLYGVIHRIRSKIPEAKITFITRPDLQEGFQLLEKIDLLIAKDWKRKAPINLGETLKNLSVDPAAFDLVIANPDPTHWLKNEIGILTPKLKWQNKWDALCSRFPELDPDAIYLGAHVHTETAYGYEKNWPFANWEKLFKHLSQKEKVRIILFGHGQSPSLALPNLIDLRGRTSFLEMLSIIKNRCSYLLVPDSGVLSMTYYLDASFPLKVVSMWADPRQGVLKQNVPSPNPQLVHTPLLGRGEDIRSLHVDEVYAALFGEAGC